jgi:hypothetical protein
MARCADQNALGFMVSALTGLPKPTNAAPGIAYMAQGGLHFETPTGDIVMMPGVRNRSNRRSD